MKTRIYYPETAEEQAKLDEAAARMHADYVVRCITKTEYPTDTKLRLADLTATEIAYLAGEKKKGIRTECTDPPGDI